tara:strand:- start:264 stop:923 length:660 start_codon:yes stop_codon:yes gene_type:complete
LPSDGTEVKFRPFLVKEQRNLLLTKEDPTPTEVMTSVKNLVKVCTFEKVDTSKIPMFDLEYLFLQIRAKSVGETVKLNVPCQNNKEHAPTETTVNVATIMVDKSAMVDSTVMVSDEIGIVMRYPTIDDSELLGNSTEENMFKMMTRCMVRIFDNESVHEMMDTPDSDIEEFLDSLTMGQLDKLGEFFIGVPQLSHSITFKCSQCDEPQTTTLRGLDTFF